MLINRLLLLALFCLPCSLALAAPLDNWQKAPGGVFNLPPKLYNPKFHGFGSTGQKIYNKIDLQDGRVMKIKRTRLYDNQGNVIATAVPSGVGYHKNQKDGGIVAGAITEMMIGGRKTEVMYAWSVNIEPKGRASGWVPTETLWPAKDIRRIQIEIRRKREALLPRQLDRRRYTPMTVVSATLPKEAAEWYVTPGRDAKKNQGKAKYYYTRDGLISGLKHVPVTGAQRFGVAHDHVPVGATFHWDKSVPTVSRPIYKPKSKTPSKYKLKVAWGYVENNAGVRWYSWINADALKPAPKKASKPAPDEADEAGDKPKEKQ